MAGQRPSRWPELFDLAVKILSHAAASTGLEPVWSFGGGTALMLQINHRESHDVDLFVDDPQLLPFLNPETQEVPLERRPTDYQTDGTRVLKLTYQELGEIDFICAAHVLNEPTRVRNVRGHKVALETPAEIIAKKIYYRGTSFQPRDMLDLAAVVEHYGADYAIAALSQCGPERCLSALGTIERAKPEFVTSILVQLMLRQSTRHLVDTAQEISRSTLLRAVRATGSSGSA